MADILNATAGVNYFRNADNSIFEAKSKGACSDYD